MRGRPLRWRYWRRWRVATRWSGCLTDYVSRTPLAFGLAVAAVVVGLVVMVWWGGGGLAGQVRGAGVVGAGANACL